MPPHPTAGQASAEYVAVVTLVAILLAGAGTAVAAPDLAGSVAGALRRGVCVVAGGVCSPGEARELGLKPCPVHVRSNAERLRGKVAIVRLEQGDALLIERRSDGTASVSFVDRARAGAEVGIGLRLSPLGIDAAAEVGGGVEFSGGRTWDFPSLAAARRFVRRFGRHETLTGEALDTLRALCLGRCGGGRPRPPEPSARYLEGGAYAEAAADLDVPGGPLQAHGELEGAVVLGRREAGPRTTWYLKVSGEAAAQLGVVIGALHAGRQGEAVIELTHERGRLAELRAVAAAGLSHELALLGATTDLPALAGRLRAASARAQQGTGLAVEAAVALDLTVPANRAAALGFLRAPTPAAAHALARRLDADGSVDINVFRTARTESETEAEIAAGLGLGGAYERVEEGRSLVGAWSLRHGGALRDREDCVAV